MTNIKNIIIFVGGKGSRLGRLTKNLPKPLIKFHGIPFVNYLLKQLLVIKPKKIYLLCGFKKEKFYKNFHNKKFKETVFKCISEKKLLGTGGSLEKSKKIITNNTLLCNGDTYFKFNFKKLNKINLSSNVICMILVKNNLYKSNKKLSNLDIKKGKVVYDKKSKYMNSGFYIISKKILKFLKKGKYSLENEILPNIINEQKSIGYKTHSEHIDIGTKKNLNLFKKISKKIQKNIFRV